MPVIGPHVLRNNLFVAPMAGVTDRPFRQLCKRLGAGYAVSEMVASNAQLWKSAKTMRRANHEGEVEPIAVQIAGADPAMMAEAARYNVDNGAQIIDINMGCPAKKVCNVAAGSALLQNEPLVQRIVEAVVAAVGTGPDAVPVTLKIRTGWDREHKNAITVARLAEAAGISMLTVHGRTRADLYRGDAEYDTIAAVKAAVRIPVVANGDITSPAKAKAVLDATGADALMIGRAAQGRPWLFREIDHFLQTGELLPPPRIDEIQHVMNEHLEDHYAFYGEFTGVRTARKHIGWYTRGLSGANGFRHRMNTLDSTAEQLAAVNAFFDAQKALSDHLVYVDDEGDNGQGESDDHNQLAA
ncbi:tRNA dihydrouridine synthase DusB [Burkholderia cenocepacia]|uniref:tRNA-dihydrouridine synthase B n=1 Tax=Burkholderia cenocepacia TaxID=95486 RepID=A0A3S9N371_9BURK|nr:tRNA dihydrouridine synthase DusB [Burkholderia cenocepacia]AZQ50140.1 tRNA dihydrouridine synthase DusB [Burkholderia cenocepacia]